MNDRLFRHAEQDARVQRVSRMIPNGPIPEELLMQVVGDAVRYMKEHGRSQADVAKAIGENPTYVSNFFSNAVELPEKKRDQLVRAIAAWMEDDYRHESVKSGDAKVSTIVVTRLRGLALNTKSMRGFSVGYGPAGIGKTTTAQLITESTPGTIYIRITKACRSEVGLLRQVWAALRKTHRQQRNSPEFERVADELRGSGRLLIIDQAHDMRDSCWRLLMDLHDECDLPILLLGTVDIRNRVELNNDPQFGQLSSRVSLKINLLPEALRGGDGGRKNRWLTLAQVREMFAKGKLRISDEAIRLLAALALTRIGAFRVARWVHKWAEQTALAAGARQVTGEHIREAVAWMEDDESYQFPASLLQVAQSFEERGAATA